MGACFASAACGWCPASCAGTLSWADCLRLREERHFFVVHHNGQDSRAEAQPRCLTGVKTAIHEGSGSRLRRFRNKLDVFAISKRTLVGKEVRSEFENSENVSAFLSSFGPSPTRDSPTLRSRASPQSSPELRSARTPISPSLSSSFAAESLDRTRSRTNRLANILDTWDVRGAQRPITDFYEVECVLGEGAYGQVQKWKMKNVQQEFDDIHVAIKQLKWKSVWGSACRRDLSHEQVMRNELKMLLVLDHPFVVKFWEWFEHPCMGVFYVMEFCGGRSLQQVLEGVCELQTKTERSAQQQFLRRCFREVTYAVSYIHSMDPPVVHRDLKPDNVMLKSDDPNSCCKLIDFGLSCLADGIGEIGGNQDGTPIFMPPEAYLKKNNDFTREMDVWALGVIFMWVNTALQLGSLQHPMLPADRGNGFDVAFADLYYAYHDEQPWNRELFEGHQASASTLLDKIFVYDESKRASAADIMQDDWVRVGDPAAAAAAELLHKGAVSKNIASYSQLNWFDRKILSLVADHASESQVMVLRRTFRVLDKDHKGTLTRQELVLGFRANDVELSQEVVDHLFVALEADMTNSINYNEWLAATIGSRILRSERSVAAAFHGLDYTGTGTLNYEDLSRAVPEDEATAIVDQIEERCGSREITFDVFRDLVHGVATRRVSVIMEDDELEDTEYPVEQKASWATLVSESPRNRARSRNETGCSIRSGGERLSTGASIHRSERGESTRSFTGRTEALGLPAWNNDKSTGSWRADIFRARSNSSNPGLVGAISNPALRDGQVHHYLSSNDLGTRNERSYTIEQSYDVAAARQVGERNHLLSEGAEELSNGHPRTYSIEKQYEVGSGAKTRTF